MTPVRRPVLLRWCGGEIFGDVVHPEFAARFYYRQSADPELPDRQNVIIGAGQQIS
jgi:hypothetical protein